MMLPVIIAVLIVGGLAFALMRSGRSASTPAAKPAAPNANTAVADEKRRMALSKQLRDAAGALDRLRLHLKAGDDAKYLTHPCESALGSFDVISSGLKKKDEKRLGTDLSERLRLVLTAEAPVYKELSRLRAGQPPVARTTDVLSRSGDLLRSAADALGGVEPPRVTARS
jgi:hypothetical protein